MIFVITLRSLTTLLLVVILGILVQMILKPGASLLGSILFRNSRNSEFIILGKTVLSNRSFVSSLSLSLGSASLTRRPVEMAGIPVTSAANVKLLNQNEAIQVDQDLFNEYKFSVDQLMELAGLSVATAVAQVYGSKKGDKVVIITGPGNNGGDGLVVARHLKLFGFERVTILNARAPTKELYINLLHQAAQNDVEISSDPESVRGDNSVGLIIDALFGFSFKPPVRPEFQPLVDLMVSASAQSIPVVAVDIPSGWDVENGPPTDESLRFMPDMLVSLTAPKMCASHFKGNYHFIGGRFVPKKLAEKYSLNLPSYPGTDCVVRIK